MVSPPKPGGVRPFLKLIEVQALRGAADHDLLRRFAAANDEAAFRVIAERHGPMVFGVCARVLGNRHDAEDALQATFLVFARRAASVRKSDSLASWLHGVARRVATRLRRTDRRRLTREQAATPPAPRPPGDDLAWAEVRAGLDEELGRLPAAYREVLVLCYLEGLTRDEAGQRLGIDPGAVKGRLERGRRLLGDRLTKRGIGLSAGLVGLAVGPPAAAAIRVGRLAADPTTASPRAAALTHEFLKGVTMSKLKVITSGLVGTLVLAAGVGMGTAQTGGPPPAAPGKQPPARALGEKVEPAKDTDEAFIRRLSKDLRGTDPTPAEVHFFLASKDANKRDVLVDLFLKERAGKGAARAAAADAEAEKRALLEQELALMARLRAAQQGTARAQAERARAAEEQARAVEDQARAAAKAAEEVRRRADALREDERARRDADAKRRADEAREDERARARREVDEAKRRADEDRAAKSRATEAPRAKPPVVPPTPALPPTGAVPPVPAVPPGVKGPPQAANVEALRIQVQLAELTLREKSLQLKNTQDLRDKGVVSAREVTLLQIEVERASLLLQQAQLTLRDAEKPAAPPEPRSAPTPRADPRPAPAPGATPTQRPEPRPNPTPARP